MGFFYSLNVGVQGDRRQAKPDDGSALERVVSEQIPKWGLLPLSCTSNDLSYNPIIWAAPRNFEILSRQAILTKPVMNGFCWAGAHAAY